MNCSKGKRYARVGGSKKSHVACCVALRCCWIMKVLLLVHDKTSKRKKINSYD